jgi:hypothetical protein
VGESDGLEDITAFTAGAVTLMGNVAAFGDGTVDGGAIDAS